MAYNSSGGAHKDLPPVPQKTYSDQDSFQFTDGYSGGAGLRTAHNNGSSDFNFVDPNAHIDNSFKDNFQAPSNPNLSLNNRIIYDYDTDGENDHSYDPQPQRGQNNRSNNNNVINDDDEYGTSRQFTQENAFYDNSNVSRQTSTKSNPFKEDPFYDGGAGKRNSTMSRMQYRDDNDSFDNVPIRFNATPAPEDQSTSLLNPYRNNKFYNNNSKTINGGFRVNDEFEPGELRPLYVDDPDKPPPTGFLVYKGKKVPIVCYLLSIIQICVFIGELGKMGALTGTPVQTQPYFNPMIGPSQYVQINMGSRYAPCMIEIKNLTEYLIPIFPCPNTTNVESGCTLRQLCGLGAIPFDDDGYKPNQWYRIFTPIFLHSGVLHIVCNLILQLLLGVDIEREIGPYYFLAIYIYSGISGNIFGANFSQDGLSSTGASGALFGIIGVNLVNFLFFSNRSQMHPNKYRKTLFYLIFEIVFTLVLGLLPGLDNFAHIGGFIAGVLLSIILLKDPNFVFQERYKYQRDPKDIKKSAIPARNSLNSFTPFEYDGHENDPPASTVKVTSSKVANLLPNMKTRKPSIFFIWVIVRIVMGVLLFLWTYLLCVNFFKNGGGHCSWCKYLSCIPIKDWCTMGTISVQTSNSSIMLLSSITSLLGLHFKYVKSQDRAFIEKKRV